MLHDLIITFLISISPLGEGRVGIPYAVLRGVPFPIAFATGVFANLLVFPLLTWLIDFFNVRLWQHRIYKKGVIKVSRMAKKKAASSIQKYGFWGLMVFVMIPLPGTGAYLGTIAASIFKIERKKAFWAISFGVVIACIIMTFAAHWGNKGLERV